MSIEIPRAPAPEALLRLAVRALLLAGLAAAAGHALFDWDPGVLQAWLPGCPIRAVTGFPCPGCGMTRALLLLVQLRCEAAWVAHPAAPALVAAMAVWGIRPPRLAAGVRQALATVALAAVLGLWIARGLLSPLPL